MIYTLGYLQVVMPVDTQRDKDILNHVATLLDDGALWMEKSYKEVGFNWRTAGNYWIESFPVRDMVKAVSAAFLDMERDYYDPAFVVFRNGKGVHEGISKEDFDYFRSRVKIAVLPTTLDDLLNELGLVEDLEYGLP